jgi:hypothetical protein
MLARNEEWCVEASLRTALAWCDQVALTLDRCTDRTAEIAHEVSKEIGGGRVMFITPEDRGTVWDEMNMRHENFVAGRLMGGTHFAIIDADETLTANLLPFMRTWLRHLAPGQILDLPMIPAWGPGVYRDDDSVWTRARLTTAFRDKKDLGWAAAADGYHHHSRPPKGALPDRMWPIEKGQGGVIHWQFANKRRLLAKHVLYRMVDHLRWPGRESAEKLNWKYDQALSAPGKLTELPDEWQFSDAVKYAGIDFYGVPWQEGEIRRLLDAHGRQAFAGLDLKGFA